MTDSECLFRGEATIAVNSDVRHGSECLCEDSTLNTKINCVCKLEDKRVAYSSFDSNKLAQLKLGLE